MKSIISCIGHLLDTEGYNDITNKHSWCKELHGIFCDTDGGWIIWRPHKFDESCPLEVETCQSGPGIRGTR